VLLSVAIIRKLRACLGGGGVNHVKHRDNYSYNLSNTKKIGFFYIVHFDAPRMTMTISSDQNPKQL
jgi:hypothetical protein